MKFTKKKAGMQEERIAGNEPVHIKAGASIPEGDMKGGINDPNTSFITGLEIENPGRGDIVQRAPYADMYCSVNGSDPVPVNSDIDCGRIRVNKDGTFEFGVGGLLPYNRPKTVKVLQVNPNPVPTAYSFTARLGDFTKVDGTVNISTQITTDDLKRLWNFTNNGLVEEIRQPNDFKIYTLTAKGLSDLIRIQAEDVTQRIAEDHYDSLVPYFMELREKLFEVLESDRYLVGIGLGVVSLNFRVQLTVFEQIEEGKNMREYEISTKMFEMDLDRRQSRAEAEAKLQKLKDEADLELQKLRHDIETEIAKRRLVDEN